MDQRYLYFHPQGELGERTVTSHGTWWHARLNSTFRFDALCFPFWRYVVFGGSTFFTLPPTAYAPLFFFVPGGSDFFALRNRESTIDFTSAARSSRGSSRTPSANEL